MHSVALLLGGNQGDRHALIHRATELIRQRIGSVALASALYETEPWGDFEVENGKRKVENFLNQALVVETELSVRDVLRQALAIEKELGRKRELSTSHAPLSTRIYTSRPIDIDIIFYDSEVIDNPDLTVPHPRMHQRRFVLEPLCEVMPDYVHPLLHKTVRQLLTEL